MKTTAFTLTVLVLTFLCLRTAVSEEATSDAKPQVEITVTVEGHVKNPGQYRLRQPANLLHALAEAGGFDSRFSSAVLLIRRAAEEQPETTMIKVNQIGFRPAELHDGDTIKVLFGCVAAGSQLITPHGTRLIEQIKIGDLVLGFDLHANRVAFGKVVSIRKETSHHC